MQAGSSTGGTTKPGAGGASGIEEYIVVGDNHADPIALLKVLLAKGFFNNTAEVKEKITELSECYEAIKIAQGDRYHPINHKDYIENIERFLALLAELFTNTKNVNADFQKKFKLLGDLVADRGAADILILKILEYLQDKEVLSISLSNHDVQGMYIWHDKQSAAACRSAINFIASHSNTNQYNSCVNFLRKMEFLRQKKIISEEEFANIVDETGRLYNKLYLDPNTTTLSMIDFIVSDSFEEVTVLTHAPIYWHNITDAMEVMLPYLDKLDQDDLIKMGFTAEEISNINTIKANQDDINTLCSINSQQLTVGDIDNLAFIAKVINKASLHYLRSIDYNTNVLPQASAQMFYKVIAFFWQRYTRNEGELPKLEGADDSQRPSWINYIHGHDGDTDQEITANHRSLNSRNGQDSSVKTKVNGYDISAVNSTTYRQLRESVDSTANSKSKLKALNDKLISKYKDKSRKWWNSGIGMWNWKLSWPQGNDKNTYTIGLPSLTADRFKCIDASATLAESINILEENLQTLQRRAFDRPGGASEATLDELNKDQDMGSLIKDIKELDKGEHAANKFSALFRRLEMIKPELDKSPNTESKEKQKLIEYPYPVLILNKLVVGWNTTLIDKYKSRPGLSTRLKPIPGSASALAAIKIYLRNLEIVRIMDINNKFGYQISTTEIAEMKKLANQEDNPFQSMASILLEKILVIPSIEEAPDPDSSPRRAFERSFKK